MRLAFSVLLAMAGILSACVNAPSSQTATGDYLGGRFAAKFNKIDVAADAFSDATTLDPGQEKLISDAFFFHLAAGDVEKAAPFAEQIIAREIADPTGLPRLTLAAKAIKAGDYETARNKLETGLKEPLARSAAHLMNVWIEAGLIGPDAALDYITTGEEDLFRGFNATHIGVLSEMAGKLDQARAAHEASARGFGGPIGRRAFGAFLERAGEAKAAREYYTILAQEPGPQRRLAAQGLKRLKEGRPSTAYQALTPAGGSAMALYSFAGAVLEQSAMQRQRATAAGFVVGEPRYNIPLALAQVSLFLDPGLDEARRLVGSVFNIYGEYAAAADVLGPISPTSSYYELAQIELATGLFRLERGDEAIAALRRTVRNVPDAMEARLTLANMQSSLGDHSGAIETATAAIKLLPEEPQEDSWRYFIVRGASYLERDNWPSAEVDLKKAVEIAPEEPTALNYLGYSWAERGVNLDEAFELIEKAVALEPQSGAITDSLGWAYFQLGNYDEAVGHLERAASLEPADPTITDHLGDVYWRLGRKREARYQWRHALTLDPGDALQSSLEKKIKSGLAPKDNS